MNLTRSEINRVGSAVVEDTMSGKRRRRRRRRGRGFLGIRGRKRRRRQRAARQNLRHRTRRENLRADAAEARTRRIQAEAATEQVRFQLQPAFVDDEGSVGAYDDSMTPDSSSDALYDAAADVYEEAAGPPTMLYLGLGLAAVAAFMYFKK